MRFIAYGVGVAAFLATSAAWAAGGVSGKGETGGKGGTGPENSTQAGAGGAAEAPTSTDTTQTQFGGKSTQNPDTATVKKVEEKPWEVSANFETHRLFRQEYNPDGTVHVENVLFAVARYQLTDHDSVVVSGGGYQVFAADAGESGVRSTDISLGYTHIFKLPEKFSLRTSVGATIPISYYSQLASNITSPSLSIGLSRKFGDLSVSAGISGRYFWDRYTTANAIGASNNVNDPTSGSGSTNAKWAVGGSISAEYDLPFYRPLSIGAGLTDSYVTFYQVGQPPADTTFYGATTNPAIDGTHQPWLQSYGGEVFVRYVMPELSGFKSDLTIALANGDPSIGYPSVLHDGIVHPYLFYYNTTEVYAALSARY